MGGKIVVFFGQKKTTWGAPESNDQPENDESWNFYDAFCSGPQGQWEEETNHKKVMCFPEVPKTKPRNIGSWRVEIR